MGEFLISVLSSLVAGAAGGIAVRSAWRITERWANSLQAALLGWRYVLVWVDLPPPDRTKLIAQLARELPGHEIVWLTATEDLDRYHLDPRVTAAVLLIASDVTKLSEVASSRQAIQDRLNAYVHKGGGLVGCHDVIYRRVGNDILTKTFGGRITGFKTASKPIPYTRNVAQLPDEFADLSPEFILNDGEVLETTWDAGVQVLFKVEPAFAATMPDVRGELALVACRCCGAGRAAWMNSADYGQNGPADAFSDPAFIKLLGATIRWAAR